MPRLGRTLAGVWTVRQTVALENGHAVVMVCQHACGQEAGHAAANHNGMLAQADGSVVGHRFGLAHSCIHLVAGWPV